MMADGSPQPQKAAQRGVELPRIPRGERQQLVQQPLEDPGDASFTSEDQQLGESQSKRRPRRSRRAKQPLTKSLSDGTTRQRPRSSADSEDGGDTGGKSTLTKTHSVQNVRITVTEAEEPGDEAHPDELETASPPGPPRLGFLDTGQQGLDQGRVAASPEPDIRDLAAAKRQSETAARIAALLPHKTVSRPTTPQVKFTEIRTENGEESMEQSLQKRENPIDIRLNGMHHFGVNKQGISRAVVRFIKPPQPQPNTICFHFPTSSLTHKYVLDLVKHKLFFTKTASVETVQFVDRNVLHGTQGLDNRWLVTLNSAEARDELIRRGITVCNRHITMRRYDDVLQEEYSEFRQYMEHQARLYAKLSDSSNDLPQFQQALTPDAIKQIFTREEDEDEEEEEEEEGQRALLTVQGADLSSSFPGALLRARTGSVSGASSPRLTPSFSMVLP